MKAPSLPAIWGPGVAEIPLSARPLAYVVTRFSGAIPCRIIAAGRVSEWGPHVRAPGLLGELVAVAQITAARPGYGKGAFRAFPLSDLAPRSAVTFGRWHYRVLPHSWAEILPELKAPAADLAEAPANESR